MKYFLWACLLGALSAVSLPLGSWVGLRFRFSSRMISFLVAFGAGALLAALSVELIAPTTLALVDGHSGGHDQTAAFLAMILGCIVGGLLYVFLDKMLNKSGGFLRKTSTLLSYYKKKNLEEKRQILDRLSRIELFQDFPPDHIESLLSALEPAKFKDGAVIAKEGSPIHEALLIVEGTMAITLRGREVLEFTSADGIFGIVPLVTNSPAMGTAEARGPVTVHKIRRERFNELRTISPEFDAACRELARDRLGEIEKVITEFTEQASNWTRTAKDSLVSNLEVPEVPFMQRAKEEHHGSPLGIWLGILLDGIPESLVIGAGMLGMLTTLLAADETVRFIYVVPFTLIAGLFLSNFPEALSSSANMLAQGWKKPRIFMMWFSLLVVTSLGAGVGYLLAGEMSHTWMLFLEGLAAGAMLTMIAAAMIPEAVLMGSGSLVGLSVLAGFLGAISSKLLE